MDMVISGRSTWDIFEKPEFGRIILIACRNQANCFNRRRVSFSSVANYACRMNFARSVFFVTLGSCYELQLPASRGHASLLKFMFGVHAQVSFSYQPTNVWRESNVKILGYTSDLF